MRCLNNNVITGLISELHVSNFCAATFAAVIITLSNHIQYILCLIDGCPLTFLQGCSLEGQSTVLENDYDTTPNHSELEESG